MNGLLRIMLVALLLMPCAATHASSAVDARALAGELYDQWFSDFVHEEFVVDVVRQMESRIQQDAAKALGGEEQVQACTGLQSEMTALARNDLRTILEDAYADPGTRQAMVVALADSFTPSTLQAYVVQARVSGSQDLLKLQVLQSKAFAQNLGKAIAESPLNMNTNASSRERLRIASLRLAPLVRRCQSDAES